MDENDDNNNGRIIPFAPNAAGGTLDNPIDDLQAAADEYQTVESDYFGHLTTDEIGDEIVDRVAWFRDELYASGRIQDWIVKLNYYNNKHNGELRQATNSLVQLGSKGEFIGFYINHYRSFLKQILGTTTINEPVFDVRAMNSDSKSLELATLCNQILDFYMRHKDVRSHLNRAAECALVLDAGYLLLEWDVNEGAEYGDDRDPLNDGDVKLSSVLPLDLIFDPRKSNWSRHDWVIVADRRPKVELVTTYPEYASQIRKASIAPVEIEQAFRIAVNDLNWGLNHNLSDDITVYKLYHRKTEYMPKGRYVLCLQDGTVLWDGPLVVDTIPVCRMVADEVIGTPFGRGPASDLLSCQQALDIITSTILTNVSNFSIQYVAWEEGCNFNESMLERGLIAIEMPPGRDVKPPTGLNLLALPSALIEERNAVLQNMQAIAGVSNVSRGQITQADPSGSSLAFQASTTAQAQGPYTANFAAFAGDVATLLLRLLRTFADSNRVIAIQGMHNSGSITFNKDKLVDFDRVEADLGNPLGHTFAGRIHAAQTLLQSGAVDAYGFLEVLNTGNLQPMVEAGFEEANFIRLENELLMQAQGQLLSVLATDDHAAHIKEHRALLNNADWRIQGHNPDIPEQLRLAVLQATMQHLTAHEQMLVQQQQQQQGPAPGSATINPVSQPAPAARGPKGKPIAGPSPAPGAAHFGGKPTSVDTGTTPMNAAANVNAQAAGTTQPRMPNMPNMPQPR